MTIETAKFVIQRSGVQSYCIGEELDTKLQEGDLMAVTRPSDDTYKWVVSKLPAGLELTINTVLQSPGNKTFTLVTRGNKGTVDWGDGTTDDLVNATVQNNNEYSFEHDYAVAGIYTLKVTGPPGLYVSGTITTALQIEGVGYPITAYGPPDADYVLPKASQMNRFFRNMSDDNIDKFDYSAITLFDAAWYECMAITEFPFIDTSSGTDFSQSWASCTGIDTTFPLLDFSKATGLYSSWDFAKKMPSPFPSIDTSSCTDFTQTWRYCYALTSFPSLDYSSALYMNSTWEDCIGLTTFPNISLPKALFASKTWQECELMTDWGDGTTTAEMPEMTNLHSAWRDCSVLETFSPLNIPKCTVLDYAWNNCSGFTSFPDMEYPEVKTMSYTWQNCTNLVTWNSNATVDLPECDSLTATWWGCSNLTSIPLLTIPKVERMWYTFYGCKELTSIPLMDTSSVKDWEGTFNTCTKLEKMPALDFSGATKASRAFISSGIKSFDGTLEFGNVTNFEGTFYNCKSLTALPFINTSSGTNFKDTFRDLESITSFPSTLDFSKGTTFYEGFKGCNLLTDFPPNMFDTTGVLESNAFFMAFTGCALTATAIENILTSLDTNGRSNITLGINAGTNASKSTWTTAANTAYDSLITKGWTVTFNS